MVKVRDEFVTIWALAGTNMPRPNTPRKRPRRDPKPRRLGHLGHMAQKAPCLGLGGLRGLAKNYRYVDRPMGVALEASMVNFQYKLYTLHLVTLATPTVTCPLLLRTQDRRV